MHGSNLPRSVIAAALDGAAAGKVLDLGVGSGLLISELIAREPEDLEAIDVFMKRTQTCVLRREASSARDVDDQADLALEPIERHLVARDRGHLEVVEG